MRLIRRALLAFALAAAALLTGGSPASAQPDDGFLTGWCHTWMSSTWQPYPCPPGRRPFIRAIEFSGEDRGETADIAADFYLAGGFETGSVFMSRHEDWSAARTYARLTGGTAVKLPGGDGPLPAATLALLNELATGGVPEAVFFGGDGAIGVNQRVEAVRALGLR